MAERIDEITPRARRNVILWAVGLLLLYGLAGFLGAWLLQGYAAERASRRESRIEQLTTPTPLPVPAGEPSAAKPVDVRVSLRMIRIREFALKESAWSAEFQLIFRWIGDGVEPGESFRIVDGDVVQRQKERSFRRGGERYEVYRVLARVNKSFDASRFPFANEALLVQVEDGTQGPNVLRYVTEARDSTLDREAPPRSVRVFHRLQFPSIV